MDVWKLIYLILQIIFCVLLSIAVLISNRYTHAAFTRQLKIKLESIGYGANLKDVKDLPRNFTKKELVEWIAQVTVLGKNPRDESKNGEDDPEIEKEYSSKDENN